MKAFIKRTGKGIDMKMKLKVARKNQTDIVCTLPVTVSHETKVKIKKLKGKFGKDVNRKIREFIDNLIIENGL